MMTFRQFAAADFRTIPVATGWSLAELGQALGRQELFTRQSPQKLNALREHALIESAVSSNRIEQVHVDPQRVGTLIFGAPLLRDRDEERTEPIVEHRADGTTRIRFVPVEAGQPTEAAMAELIERWGPVVRDRVVPPLVALGAFSLDFLCVHPFRDGNGRVSRLLMLLLSYHAGAEVGRFISIERLIEQSKDRYYETLEQSSQGWHEQKHNPWPFINYVLWVLKSAYEEFERRVGEVPAVPGEKRALVVRAIDRAAVDFSVAALQRACPGVSIDMIRHVLKSLRDDGRVECTGRGRSARWRKTPIWSRQIG